MTLVCIRRFTDFVSNGIVSGARVLSLTSEGESNINPFAACCADEFIIKIRFSLDTFLDESSFSLYENSKEIEIKV